MPSATDPPQAQGRGLDRREVARIARSAALTIYGVTAVSGARWYERVAARLGLGTRGVRVRTSPQLQLQVNLELAPSVPREQVLANVRDAIQYAVQRDVGRPIDELTLTVAAR